MLKKDEKINIIFAILISPSYKFFLFNQRTTFYIQHFIKCLKIVYIRHHLTLSDALLDSLRLQYTPLA